MRRAIGRAVAVSVPRAARSLLGRNMLGRNMLGRSVTAGSMVGRGAGVGSASVGRPSSVGVVSTVLLAVLLAGQGVCPAAADSFPIVKLRALDKVTARTRTIYAPVGDPVKFGALEITARSCDKRPPEETPESAAFLEIVERRSSQPPVDVFHGWMFASSPGLSAMQHAVYDVWVLDCVSTLPSAEDSTSGGGSQ